jgi:hypothetical protein
MAIYNIFDYAEKASSQAHSEEVKKGADRAHLAEVKVGFHEENSSSRDRILSSLAARFFFLLLLIADVLWGVYILSSLALVVLASALTCFKIPLLNRVLAKLYLSLKRFLVGGLSLFVALISPALGIMFACTYFLMYDKEGIEEVVPSSLREQFKEFFSP